ncbi:possible anti-sigma factor [Alloactinosynnema sp. L-07]|uniref:anti-sigma factor family protein n=1 Tax=Alloactinosynnema sp. L-07 TaxID=1653480 RepID=UPI00065F0738|nr:zf-HC2 domain-containing protein [Alloactinosynnema sp. L-07]CRK57505.1 possible anti-sigma factor [Alloactinosynnema sp. L-07]
MNENAHRALKEVLGAYALDQLDEHERLAVEAHLAGCQECRAELREITPVAESLRLVDVDQLGPVPPSPPPDLGEAVLARIRAERGERVRAPRWAVPAAAAVAAVALGAGVGWWAHPDAPAPTQDAKVPLEAVAVRGPDPRISASAQLVPHTWGVEIKLTATGFETGEPYRVMVTDADGRKIPAGEFIGTGPKEMKCNLNSSVLRANANGFEVTDPSGALVLESTF